MSGDVLESRDNGGGGGSGSIRGVEVVGRIHEVGGGTDRGAEFFVGRSLDQDLGFASSEL